MIGVGAAGGVTRLAHKKGRWANKGNDHEAQSRSYARAASGTQPLLTSCIYRDLLSPKALCEAKNL